MLEFIEVTTALGSKKETNSDISDMVNWSSEEIYEKTGIKYRYISDSKQSAETLALEAADKIQKKRLDDIDLVVSVSNTQEDEFPPIANFVHSYLDLNKDQTKKMIEVLMGDDVAPRKDFITNNALNVVNLDI